MDLEGLARKQRGRNEEKDDCGLGGNERENEMWTCEKTKRRKRRER